MFKTKEIVMLFLMISFLTVGAWKNVEAARGESPFIPEEEYKKELGKYGNIHIKAADWKDGSYELTEQFEASKVDLNQIETAEQLEEAAQKLKTFSGKRSAKVRADKNGEIEIKNLETGVYLFVAEKTKEYDRITPFLIALPTWNAENREMSYEVEVIPKHIPIVEKQEAKPVETGDAMQKTWYSIGLLSLGIVVILCTQNIWKKQK